MKLSHQACTLCKVDLAFQVKTKITEYSGYKSVHILVKMPGFYDVKKKNKTTKNYFNSFPTINMNFDLCTIHLKTKQICCGQKYE